MQIKYDIPKLEQIINDIFVLTGLSIDFLNQNYEKLCGRTKDNDFCSVLHETKEHHGDWCSLRFGLSFFNFYACSMQNRLYKLYHMV